MAETDILNPTVRWDEDIDDSIGPDYGFDQLSRSTLATVQPAFGGSWSRAVAINAPSTTFSWVNRSLACIEKLQRWAAQYEDGFFTFIDHDRGRHYVGRFTGDLHVIEAGNDRWNAQGWTFQVEPLAPMLEYPADFDRWGITVRPVGDDGKARAGVTAAAPNAWARPVAVDNGYGVMVQPRQMTLAASTAGDQLTMEYIGYGFRLSCGIGPTYGSAHLVVDGINVQDLDFSATADGGTQVVYTNVQMPLGAHRVQLVMIAGSILVDKLEVIR